MPERDVKEERRDDEARFTTSLAALAYALVLGLVGLYLLDALAHEGKLEDCLMQGRMNCEPIVTSNPDDAAQ